MYHQLERAITAAQFAMRPRPAVRSPLADTGAIVHHPANRDAVGVEETRQSQSASCETGQNGSRRCALGGTAAPAALPRAWAVLRPPARGQARVLCGLHGVEVRPQTAILASITSGSSGSRRSVKPSDRTNPSIGWFSAST